MVINIGALKSGDLKAVEGDIKAVRRATKSTTVLKIIIETCLLTDDEKVLACEIAKKAGADFVKTSTGFSFPRICTGPSEYLNRWVHESEHKANNDQ